MNNSIDKTTPFVDTANSPTTTSPSNTKVEDWMLEIWDWIDNHSFYSNKDNLGPRDPQSLQQVERLDLGFGKSKTYNVDDKSVFCDSAELTKPLPAAIGNLKNLKYLRLIGFSELPDEIAQLDNLEELVFLKCGYVEFPKVLCELSVHDKNAQSLKGRGLGDK